MSIWAESGRYTGKTAELIDRLIAESTAEAGYGPENPGLRILLAAMAWLSTPVEFRTPYRDIRRGGGLGKYKSHVAEWWGWGPEMTPEFQREFLRLAAVWLECRMRLIPSARESEGLLRGMWDQSGEMRLMCQEALGPKSSSIEVQHPACLGNAAS